MKLTPEQRTKLFQIVKNLVNNRNNIRIVSSDHPSKVFVYEDKVFNKYTLACYLAGEMNISTKNWKAGIFTKDAGSRPINWRIDNMPNGNGYSSYVFPLKFNKKDY